MKTLAFLLLAVSLFCAAPTSAWPVHGSAATASCPLSSNPTLDGCSGAQLTGTIYDAHLADTGAVVALNLFPGTGYTAGTYAWSACSGTATGTVTVGTVGTPTLVSGGSGYPNAPGADASILQFDNGAVVGETAASGGVITAIYSTLLTQPTSTPAGTRSQTATSSTGTGATASFAYSSGFVSYTITTRGSSCLASDRTISLPGGAGAGSGGKIVASIYQTTRHGNTVSEAAIDYPVGPLTGTVFKNPTSDTLPGCATRAGSPTVVTINSAPCTMDGWKFQAGQQLKIANALGGPASGTTPCQAVDANEIIISNSEFDNAGSPATVFDGSGSDGGAEDICFKYDTFSDAATVGTWATGVEQGIVESSQTAGALGWLYNNMANVFTKVEAIEATPASSKTRTETWKYNLELNIAIGNGADGHGENVYLFAATTTNQHVVMDDEYNTLVYNNAIQPSLTVSATASDATPAAEGVTIDSVTVNENACYAQGPWAATGSNNFGQTYIEGSGCFFIGRHGGTFAGVITTGTYTNNDVDYTGEGFPFNALNNVSTDFLSQSGTNMVTGNICTPSGTCN